MAVQTEASSSQEQQRSERTTTQLRQLSETVASLAAELHERVATQLRQVSDTVSGLSTDFHVLQRSVTDVKRGKLCCVTLFLGFQRPLAS